MLDKFEFMKSVTKPERLQAVNQFQRFEMERLIIQL